MSNITNSFDYYFIYRIINVVNKKSYVGFHATDNLNDGYFGSGMALNRSIKKYGEENFIIGILEFINADNWREKERYWIKNIKSHISQNGYNMTFGGDGTLGLKFSKESRLKMSNIAKNRSNEHKKKLADSKRGKKLTLEHKEKISKSCKANEKLVLQRQTAFLGKIHTKESKKLIGDAHRGKVLSEETKLKLRDHNLGKVMSEETKQKISKSGKGKVRTTEMRKKYSESKLGVKRITILCPHCERMISAGNYSRWHGDNCKLKFI